MPWTRRPPTQTILLSLIATLACSESAAPDPLAACSGPVTLTVGSGTSPSISWAPTCRLFLLLVEDPSGGGDQWGVLSDSSNAIAAPVSYGTLPTGATKTITPAIALQSGHLYHAVVYRFTGPGHEDGTVIGQTDFTP